MMNDIQTGKSAAVGARIARNAVSLLTADVLNRAGTFALYALLARYLPLEAFGKFSLALTLFYVFQVVAGGGLKTLVVRQVAKNKSETGKYALHGMAIVVTLSAVSLLGARLLCWVMGYAPDTTSLILLIVLAVFPQAASSIAEGILQAWEQMHYIALVQGFAAALKVITALYLLQSGQGVMPVALVIVSTHTVVAVVEVALLTRFVNRHRHTPVWSAGWLRQLAMQGRAFAGIEILIAFWGSLNILLLSRIAGIEEVGIFGAAMQLTVPLRLVFQSIAAGVLPHLSQSSGTPAHRKAREVGKLLEVVLAITLPAVILLWAGAEYALLTLYERPDFLQATWPLRLLAASLVFTALCSALGQSLIAGNQENTTLRIVALDTLAGLTLGIVLIAFFGVTGAAVSTLLVAALNLVLHWQSVGRSLGSLPVLSWTWKPGIAAVGMVISLQLLSNTPTLPSLIVSGATYLTVLVAVSVWDGGGPNVFHTRLREFMGT